MMAQVNHRVASQARKYVYGNDNRQLRFVENRLGKCGRPLPLTPPCLRRGLGNGPALCGPPETNAERTQRTEASLHSGFLPEAGMGTQNTVCEFSRPYDRVTTRPPHPDGTGYVRGLYAIDDPDANVVNAIEDMFLKPNDGMAAEALHCLLREVPFPQPQRMRHAWTRFILSLLIRYPEAISEMKRHFRRISEECTRKPESRRNPLRSRNTRRSSD